MSLCKNLAVKDNLSHLTGALSLSLLSSAIITANGEVTKAMDSETEKNMKNCKGGEYAKYSLSCKDWISEVCCSA